MKSQQSLAAIGFIGAFICLFAFLSSANAQPTDWIPKGMGGGGALFSPGISPHNTNEVFIACDMTDLFHTTDMGMSWEVVPFTQIRAFPDTRVQFTSDPNILYAIHFDFLTDLRVPVKSSDGGKTWAPLANDPTSGEAYYLYADDAGTNRLFVSNYDEVFFSADGGNSFRSIYSHNDNVYIGGAFWDGANIYIGANHGVLVSSDNGSSFSLASIAGIPSSEGMVSFAGAKQGGTTRFFCVTLDINSIWPAVTGGEYWDYRGIYALDYGVSSSWARRTNGLGADDHPFFISMAKNNIDIVYVAGGNVASSYPIVFKSTDGGSSWQENFLATNNQNINSGWSGYRGDRDWWYGEFALGFTVAPTNPDVAVFTDLGFAHRTTDGGNTWQQMYVSQADQNPANAPTPKGKSYRSVGLENTSCWWLNWADDQNIFAAFTDITGMRSTDGGESWSRNFDNLDVNSIYYVLTHPNTGVLYAATSSVHDMYQSTYLQDSRIDGGSGAALYSSDKGQTWQTLHDFAHPVIWLALDPNNNNRLYASVIHSSEGGVYMTNDMQNGSNSSWTKLSDPPRTEGHPINIHVLNDGTLVSTYSGRRDAGGTFTSSSGVFVSTNGGSSWLDRSDPGMLYWTKDIVIDPHDATQNTWYVSVFSGWGGPPNGLGGVYKTTNRGVSWMKINDLDRVESCTISPTNANIMYLTTEADGLWYTKNLNSATPAFTFVSSYPFQHPVRVFYDPHTSGKIWVTSFGNGMRVGDNSVSAISDGPLVPQDFRVTIFPNPASSFFKVKLELDRPQSLSIKVYNILGKEIAARVNRRAFATGAIDLEFSTADLPSGIYYLAVATKETRIVKKMVIMK